MSPTSKARKERDRAAKAVKVRGFLNLCTVLAEDKEFSALLAKCTDPAPLNTYVFTRALEITEYKHNYNFSKINAFTKLKSLLGSYSCQELPASVQILHQSFRDHTSKSKKPRLRAEFRKNRIAKRVGFHPSSRTSIKSLQPIISHRSYCGVYIFNDIATYIHTHTHIPYFSGAMYLLLTPEPVVSRTNE
jgi:hypothetical protein